MEIVESEWEGSEDFAVVVDAVMEHEAISGMVEVAIIKMKMELESVLRRVQGMEVCIHVSVTNFDQRLHAGGRGDALSKKKQRQCRCSNGPASCEKHY